jgi:hypothetical protein
MVNRALLRALLIGCLAVGAAGCGGNTYQAAPEPGAQTGAAPPPGSAGVLFSDSSGEGTEGAVAVNAFLWRASLDTISFMPLSSADPFGGVIISDWYSPPETPDERFKVNVYILGRVLRADGLKVSVFRQTQDAAGTWADAVVGADVATEFENAVLTRARELRLQAVDEGSKS